jgi:hypothetical protein
MSTNKAVAVTECSARIAECEAMAKCAPTLEQRDMLRRIGEAWQRLREQIDKTETG